MNAVEIGRQLRKLRGKRTQREVSKAIGCSESAVNMWENGLRIPRDEVKKRLSDYYGVSVEEIFFK